MGLLAGRLYVLDQALEGIESGAPNDVFVYIRPSHDARGGDMEHTDFTSTVTQMYVQWADRRGMHLERLDMQDGADPLAVSGLGCGEILLAETGLHVLEHVDEDRDGSPVVDRDQVQVVVVARTPHAEARSDDVEHAARSALAKVEAPSVIVRRYRPGKAPLVRTACAGIGRAGLSACWQATSTSTSRRARCRVHGRGPCPAPSSPSSPTSPSGSAATLPLAAQGVDLGRGCPGSPRNDRASR